MLVFFRCVVEAVAEKGVRGLAAMVPGGPYAADVAAAVWKKYRERRKEAEIRDEIRGLAEASFQDARKAAVEAVRASAPEDATVEDRDTLALFLSQIPGAVRVSLKRPEDATGRTVPAAFSLRMADDVARLLPDRPPRFRPADPVPGLDGWSLVEPLGAGGFGEVWLARHRTNPAQVGAVKFCHDEQARDLKRESDLIRRVMAAGKHPNIVELKHFYLEGEAPWLMFEFIPDGDLSDLIRVGPVIGAEARVRQAVGALRQLGSAVAHFHRLPRPVVHRDLKPSNILLDKANRRLLVTDFGIGAVAAKNALAEESRGGTTAAGRLVSYLKGSHTPLYSSPQQRSGAAPDPRDDVHALGVIGYQLLTGQLEHGPSADFADYLRDSGSPQGLIDLVGVCVAHNPERRPADAADFRRRVEAIAASPAPYPVAPIRPPHATVPPAPAGDVHPLVFVVDHPRLERYRTQAGGIPLRNLGYDRNQYLPDPPPDPDPLPEDLSSSQPVVGVLGTAAGVGGFLCVLGLANRALLYIGLLVALIFGAAVAVVVSNSPYRRELSRRRGTCESAARRLEAVEARYAERGPEYEQRHRLLVSQIDELVGTCRQLEGKYAVELLRLQEQAESVARREHMRASAVAAAEITNVGEKLKQALVAHGIETAADVSAERVQLVPGFGPDRTASVVAWREAVARAFRFDTGKGVPESQLRPLIDKYAGDYRGACHQIEKRLAELGGLEADVRRDLAAIVPDIRRAAADWARADAGLRLIEEGA